MGQWMGIFFVIGLHLSTGIFNIKLIIIKQVPLTKSHYDKTLSEYLFLDIMTNYLHGVGGIMSKIN